MIDPVIDLAAHLDWIRGQFPALALEQGGQPVIFLDGPGGTQVPQRVIDAMADYLAHANANTGGVFLTSRRTDATIAAARSAVADLLGCDPDEIVFGPNMTTLTFGFSRAVGREIKPGDEVVVTRLDHDANVAPWRTLEERGAVVRFAEIDPKDCTLDMEEFAGLITQRTRIVAVPYASNAVGTVTNVGEVIRLAHAVGALVYVDAVHYAPHGPIDVRELDCDVLACSAYKFFGPHLGILYAKRDHLRRFHPYKVRPASDDCPDRWETGTQNHEGLAGLVAAVEYLADLGRRLTNYVANRRAALLAAMQAIRRYERVLAERLLDGLLGLPGVTLYGITDPSRLDQRVPTVAMRFSGMAPRDAARFLAERGIFAWAGNFYAINLTERLGVESSGGLLRLGLVHYNTPAEVDRVVVTLEGLSRRR